MTNCHLQSKQYHIAPIYSGHLIGSAQQRTRMRFLIALMVLTRVSQSQKLLDLKDFTGSSTTLINHTAPYSLYISATSDSDDLLSFLFIKTDGQQIALSHLKRNRAQEPFTHSLPFRVTTEASIISELSVPEMNLVKGFLYLTTSSQMNDNSFYVLNVDDGRNITLDDRTFENCTLVFLNSDMSTEPIQSSIISKWNQSSDSSVFIYQGVPSGENEKNNSHIFSNPVLTSSGMRFIDWVEKFSISLPAFYMKTHKSFQFSILADYLELNMTRTYQLTTTGFYMKPFNEPDRNITVVTMRTSSFLNEDFNKTVGANAIGSMPKGSSVTFDEKEDDAMDGFTVTPTDEITSFSTPIVGWNITFSSENATEGQFFVQYYILGYGYQYD